MGSEHDFFSRHFDLEGENPGKSSDQVRLALLTWW